MKTIRFAAILLALAVALAGPAYADTSTTAASQGSYPAGTSFNGVNLSGLQFATGTVALADGTAEGIITIDLKGTTALGTATTIKIDANVTGGSSSAANISTLNGTATIDMGDGTAPLTGVPIVATVTTNDQHQGTVGLVIGATALPAATISGGSMSITNLDQ